jgi:hypothetical protein
VRGRIRTRNKLLGNTPENIDVPPAGRKMTEVT